MTKIGLELKTYNVGSMGSPVYTDEIGIVKEESVGIEKALADVTDRRANGWRVQRGTLKEGSIEMTLNYDADDTDFQAFENAFFNDGQVVLWFADGDATEIGDYRGLMAACRVTAWNQDRPLEDATTVEITLTLDLEESTNLPPTWHELSVVA